MALKGLVLVSLMFLFVAAMILLHYAEISFSCQ